MLSAKGWKGVGVMQYRDGEKSAKYFRANRFFCICEKWFFASRENVQIGPFQNEDEAEIELMLYLRHVNEGGDLFASLPNRWNWNSCLVRDNF